MTQEDPTKLFEETDILTLEDVKRLTKLVFIPSGYIVQLKDIDNNILWEDAQTVKFRGSQIGNKCYKVNFGRDYPCPHCTSLSSIEGMTPQIKEDRSIIDGKWYRIIALPIIYEGKVAAIELIQDITAEKHQRQIFDSLQSKDSLVLNIVRHDVPNYLNIINMALESLKMTDNLGEEEKTYLNIAQANASHTISILEELRNLSRLEDPLTNLEQVDVVSVLENCISEVSTMFPDKNLQTKIDVRLLDNTGIIWANDLLMDIFLNILTNAIKFTPDPTVRVDAQLTNYLDDQEYIQIEFVDYGNGIPPEIKEVLFDRAERLNRGWKSSKGSTGLGVTIVKSLVEIFGGELFYLNRVKGDWTKGTKIIIRFPQVLGRN
ncbi:MAG: sensor histidine kinase [Candidatus Hodarchaeales archaeon]|jgi:signal transduction histidine kinase